MQWSLVRLLLREARGDDTLLIFLSIYRATIFSRRIARILGAVPGRGPIHVFHAELAALGRPRRRNPLLRLFDLAAAFHHVAAMGDRVVLLERSIREAFLREFPGFRDLALLWPHPVPGVGVAARHRSPDVVSFGFLGFAAESKGFDRFQGVAAAVRDELGSRVSFRAIGHTEYDAVRIEPHQALDIQPRRAPWPRDEFLAAAGDLDFVCLFYDADYYRFVASGVLLDAVALGKPVVAPRIRLVEALAEEFGEIGMLYEPDSGPTTAVREAIAIAGTPRYRHMVANLKRLAQARGVRSLAERIARDLAA
jgi:hypothetical protein